MKKKTKNLDDFNEKIKKYNKNNKKIASKQKLINHENEPIFRYVLIEIKFATISFIKSSNLNEVIKIILNIKDFEEKDRIKHLKKNENRDFFVPLDDANEKSIDKLLTIMQGDKKTI